MAKQFRIANEKGRRLHVVDSLNAAMRLAMGTDFIMERGRGDSYRMWSPKGVLIQTGYNFEEEEKE